MDRKDSVVETLPDDCVLVAGGGPVGLVLALILAQKGVRSVLLERSATPSRYPKTELTLARSMEIFRQLGFADAIREHGIASNEPFIERLSSGLGAEKSISSWNMPSVDSFREVIASNNDGSMPLEPCQRISGNNLESWLRARCDSNPFVDARYGWTVTGATEKVDVVEVIVLPPDNTGVPKKIRCRYAVGCDGASSVIRKSLGIREDGGAVTGSAVTLIHFKSRDLERLHRQGRFWHTIFPGASKNSLRGMLISQDDKEIWTVHDILTPGYEPHHVNAEECIARVLGGLGGPYEVGIDEIIAQSTWIPTVAMAQAWSGKQGRIFLAGDACHQTVPAGGYGMNLGLADAWDLGWKLAAKIQGWAGSDLLATYETERRPVATLMQHWGKAHGMKLMQMPPMDPAIINSPDEEGQAHRATIQEYVQSHDDHNQNFGLELGYRYQSPLCVASPLDETHPPPIFDNRAYVPTTFPGYRCPHVFLNDGSAIFDHFGLGFTLVVYADSYIDSTARSASHIFEAAARLNSIPLKVVSLIGESHASQIWGAKLVLVRPDGHSSWRGNSLDDARYATEILLQASGHTVEDVQNRSDFERQEFLARL